MASKIGKALGGLPGLGGSSDEMGDDMDVESMESPPSAGGVGKAEILAMKQFERASTPEAKAQALKDFLEACGAISGDSDLDY